jgi:hypothetical protein
MSERDQYQQALTHAKAGDLQAARKLLLKIDHPKAKALLVKVDAAIAKRPKKKPNRLLFVAGGTVLLLVLVFGGFYVGSLIYSNIQASQQEARIRAAKIYCYGYFAVEFMDLEREAFDAGCQEEAEITALVYDAEIDLCLNESQNGQLTERLLTCMEREAVYMTGTYLREAAEPERLSVPGRGD